MGHQQGVVPFTLPWGKESNAEHALRLGPRLSESWPCSRGLEPITLSPDQEGRRGPHAKQTTSSGSRWLEPFKEGRFLTVFLPRQKTPASATPSGSVSTHRADHEGHGFCSSVEKRGEQVGPTLNVRNFESEVLARPRGSTWRSHCSHLLSARTSSPADFSSLSPVGRSVDALPHKMGLVLLQL